MDNPGFVAGKHFTEYVEEVRQLKRDGELNQAEKLLLKLVDATEAENSINHWGVAPWYYEQLAIVYAKQKNQIAELAILERYESQQKAPGASPSQLAERLRKLRTKIDIL